ncbi:1,4-dihydroxy-2-naphthoate polyprenyltransferase [Carboxydochorda subterranea]|uniref:1,4-dihydroxy-2-naphthoate octaprenyltransferase n=1 Tax=Carboxydichorda subterranea TaxID=3109565 RepID=A0ABZ1BXD2_9FIRM|nr:1,4-dihydroxy-2-naphthoate polyprenyltransferase [Limnochorda sp. L945t]WRP17456.1 1,4-dihydroxy-2-naphthoate polyprenyltransferase [Limnochorda sp. L945t]
MGVTGPAEAAAGLRQPGVSRAKAWVMAARIPTLPAATAPVLAGTGAAAAHGPLSLPVFLATLAAALLIQVGTNFANDLYDFRKGADRPGRLGPTRVTQTGLLSERDVERGTIVAFGAAVLIGAYLASVGGWPIVAVGLASIVAGVLYTGGPWPIGYHGLGDLFVFVFFGVVAVTGTFYLQAGAVTPGALLASVPVGLLVTDILVVNNLRDIDQDRQAGKRTLAVRIGEQATRIQYALFVVVALAMPAVLRAVGAAGPLFWLPWLSAPIAWPLVRRVLGGERGATLNQVLKGTGRLLLAYSALLAIGMARSP